MDLYEHQGKDLFRAPGHRRRPRGVVATAGERRRGRRASWAAGASSRSRCRSAAGARGAAIVAGASRRSARRGGRARMLSDGFRATPVTRVLVEELVAIAAGVLRGDPLDRSTGDVPGDGVRRGRHGHRGGRPHAARGAPPGPHRSDARASAPTRSAYLTGTLPQAAREGASDVLPGSTRCSRKPTPRWSRSTRWCCSRTAAWSRSTRRSPSTTTRCSATRDIEALRAAFPIDPVAGAGQREGPAVREARRRGRDHRQRRRPGDVHARRRDPGRGQGRELPRRGRRGQRRPDGHLARGGAVRPGGPAVLVNIFGGITRCDLVAQGILEALERVEATVPIVVRLDGTNAEEGRADPRRCRAPAHRAGRHDAGGRPQRAAGCRERGGLSMAVLIDGRTRARGAGHHRPRGHVPHAAQPRLRHERGGRGHARARRARTSRGSRCSTRWPRRSRDTGANTVDDLRAGPVRRRGDPGGGRRRRAARGVHHRGHPGPGHGARAQLPAGGGPRRWSGRTAPGSSRRAKANVGIIPGEICMPGRGGAGVAVGHARLSDRARAHAAGDRAVDLHRHGRRPGARHRVHRVARAVRGRTRRPTWS